jgi:hypothetical protein
MSIQRPDIGDEDIGIRAFQLRKERAAERAIERLRHGLGAAWANYTPREVGELQWLFGEMWSYVHRDEWDELHFGNLTTGDVVKMLSLAVQLRGHTRDASAVLTEAAALVTSRS